MLGVRWRGEVVVVTEEGIYLDDGVDDVVEGVHVIVVEQHAPDRLLVYCLLLLEVTGLRDGRRNHLSAWSCYVSTFVPWL